MREVGAPLFVVMAMGPHRQGVIRNVTGRLLELDCNILDGESSLISGNLTFRLFCSAPSNVSLSTVQSALAHLPKDLHVRVWPADESLDPAQPTHHVSIYGRDRPGILHRVASVLDENDAAICDMTFGRSFSQTAEPEFIIALDIQVPPRLAVTELRSALRTALGPMELRCRVTELHTHEKR